jgi:Restriction endonuclease
MSAVQGEYQERNIVTADVVDRVRSEGASAKASWVEAQDRLSKIVKLEVRLSKRLKAHNLIKRIRQLSDAWTTRIGGYFVFLLIPSLVVLVFCHLVRLPVPISTIAFLAILSASAFLGTRFFEPGDRTLDSVIDCWNQELLSLQGQRWGSEAEVAETKAVLDATYSKYQTLASQFQSRINQLRSENWRHLQAVPFENFLAEVLREWGYEVQTTKVTGDQGVDLIASKDGQRTAIQAKGYLSSKVGNDAIQQVYTGMKIHKCVRCAVITNSAFTSSARQAAGAVGCLLIDGEKIPLLVEGQFRL